MDYLDEELIGQTNPDPPEERQADRAPKIDLDALAREIIKLLKEELRRENERRGRW